MTKTISVGLVGTGKMGILHGGILNSMDVVELKAVAEKEKRTHSYIKTVLPNIRIYSDYQVMLEKEALDLVYITTPTHSHVEIAEACVDKGINFFVEKPLGTSANECLNLLRKTKQNPVINMVGYCYHFVDTFKKAKEIIYRNVLGNLVHLSSYMYVSQILSKKNKGGTIEHIPGSGVLNIFATHLIDILQWLFGDVYRVDGNTKSYYSTHTDDFAHAYLMFKSGLEGYMDASWSIRNYRLPEIKIEVEGEKGKLVITSDYVKLFLTETLRWKAFYKQDLYEGVDIDVGGPEYTREDKHMVQSVLEKRNTMIDILYAIKVQKITDAIYESALKEAPVIIDFGGGVE
ncbi:MAG: Gfo/Idh/MocA family protein [Promethearchaeota archaeon]